MHQCIRGSWCLDRIRLQAHFQVRTDMSGRQARSVDGTPEQLPYFEGCSPRASGSGSLRGRGLWHTSFGVWHPTECRQSRGTERGEEYSIKIHLAIAQGPANVG